MIVSQLISYSTGGGQFCGKMCLSFVAEQRKRKRNSEMSNASSQFLFCIKMNYYSNSEMSNASNQFLFVLK